MGISLYNYNYIVLITYADKSRTLKTKQTKKTKKLTPVLNVCVSASTNIKSYYTPYKVKPNITLFSEISFVSNLNNWFHYFRQHQLLRITNQLYSTTLRGV